MRVKKQMYAMMITCMVTASVLAGCGAEGGNGQKNQTETSAQASAEMNGQDGIPVDEEAIRDGSANGMDVETFSEKDVEEEQEEGDLIRFRPADCGVPAQETYEYPFIGLRIKLTKELLAQMESRDVYVSQKDAYEDAETIRYGMMKFFALNEEQKNREGTSMDDTAWEAELEKIGVIGAYQKDQESQLDEWTGCDTHEKIGESEDGAYVYYLSTNSKGNEEKTDELKKSDISVIEMRPLDPNYTYDAFSVGKDENVSSVGTFATEDIFGNSYTQEMFKEYDLTLVNAFATWCSPCVEEMPELEKLQKALQEKGIKFQVAAVVMDTKTETGTDPGAVENAKLLAQRSGATFPFLMPDSGNMNQRLKGLESFPESFFVDRDGNIVGKTYYGANTFEDWMKIVEEELAAWEGEKG